LAYLIIYFHVPVFIRANNGLDMEIFT
jgi:hypothetical protein